MMYDHEQRERREPRDIVRLAMPKKEQKLAPLMFAYLHERELNYQLAVANGWYPTNYDEPRVVIPCVNTGKFNYWQARVLRDTPHLTLRYDSPAIPRKDSIVYLGTNFDFKTPMMTKVAITEGPMDALAAADFMPAIAIMGGAPSLEVVEHIKTLTRTLGLTEWVLIPDGDNLAMVKSFLGQNANVSIKIPTGKDLAAMPKWEREKLLT